jgi:WD40 repeat protein
MILMRGETKSRLWDADIGEPAGPEFDAQACAAFTDDSQVVAMGGISGIQLRRAVTGEALCPLLKHDGAVHFVRFSEDGKTLFAGGDDQLARFWDVQTGQRIGPFLSHQGPVMFGAFCPGEKIVVTMGFDRIARLWDRETGKPVGGPMPHPGVIRSGDMSRDGKVLLIPGQDGTARLWDLAVSKPLGPPLEHRGPVSCSALSPDGAWAVTGSFDGMARIWKLPRPVPDDVSRIRRWVESLTRMQIDANGVTTPLEEEQIRNLPGPELLGEFLNE